MSSSSTNIIRSKYPDANIVQHLSLPEFLSREFRTYGDKTALISPKYNKSYTFSELIAVSRRLAVGLHAAAGVRAGHVVTTCAVNDVQLVPAMLAVGLLGAVVNTANPAYTMRELTAQFDNCNVRCVITTTDVMEKIRAVKEMCPCVQVIITLDKPMQGSLYLPDLMLYDDREYVFPKVNQDDLAFLMNSSGTTGLPKAVMLTHRSMVANMCQMTRRFLKGPAPNYFSPTPDDISLGVFPMFHVGGAIVSTFWPLLSGSTVLVLDRFEPDTFVRAVRTYKVTMILVPPPVLVHFAKSPSVTEKDFESVKYIFCGGASTGKALSEATEAKIKPEYIIQMYGATELSPGAIAAPVSPLTRQKHGSTGVLVPSTLGKVIDIESGDALGPMKQGEICIKGPQIMKGYLNNVDATNSAIDSDGWLHTGDIGYYDHDEYFYIVDRVKDTIKVKAFQVSPAELEGILFTHPSIADAVVVGVPDAYAGELPRAYVVLKQGGGDATTEEEIKKFVADQVTHYKRLQGGVRFVSEIPKTASGKALRRQLREQAQKEIKAKL